jgi:A/G-specific adenine glycosylase
VVERFAGELPRAAKELESLPGIGPYSAGAIASIAFDECVPVVDGNVIRVLTRLFALRGDPARAPLKRELWQRAASLVPKARPGDFNQALMELGATLCVPENPRCSECPLSAACAGRAAGIERQLPELAARPKPTLVDMAAAVVERRGRVLVVRRAADAPRWASMWQFPSVELAPGEAAEAGAERAALELAGVEARAETLLGAIRHSVTRYQINLRIYRCASAAARVAALPAAGFKQRQELESLAMPAAHRRIARLLEEGDG